MPDSMSKFDPSAWPVAPARPEDDPIKTIADHLEEHLRKIERDQRPKKTQAFAVGEEVVVTEAARKSIPGILHWDFAHVCYVASYDMTEAYPYVVVNKEVNHGSSARFRAEELEPSNRAWDEPPGNKKKRGAISGTRRRQQNRG